EAASFRACFFSRLRSRRSLIACSRSRLAAVCGFLFAPMSSPSVTCICAGAYPARPEVGTPHPQPLDSVGALRPSEVPEGTSRPRLLEPPLMVLEADERITASWRRRGGRQ